MILTKEQVQSIFSVQQDKISAICAKLPELKTLENCELTDNTLAIIYKEILDYDSHPIIFNIPFSLCLEDPSFENTTTNLVEFKKIVPLYLTYKEIGYANLELLKNSDSIDNNDLLVFKILGNIRLALSSGDNINEDMSNTIYCALFLYILNLETQRQIDAERIKALAKYASQLTSIYLHPEGIDLLLARREGIAASIDPFHNLHDTVSELLSQTEIVDSLLDDSSSAQTAEEQIVDKIAEDEARTKRIEERKQKLKDHTTALLATSDTRLTSLQGEVSEQLSKDKAATIQQSAANLVKIQKHYEDVKHDISISRGGGGMFSMPGVNAPMPSGASIGFSVDSGGSDIVGRYTRSTIHGPQSSSFSIRETLASDMGASMQRAQQIGRWWDNEVTHVSRDSYVQRSYVPSSLTLSISAPAASVPAASSTPKLKAKINLINPHIAAIATKNPEHLAAEKKATESIDKDVKSLGSILKDVLQSDASYVQKIKAVIKEVANGDYSSVEKRILERDKMHQELRGTKPESSQATIAVAAVSKVVKNVVVDTAHAAKAVASTIGDAQLMEHPDPYLSQPAASRMQKRTDSVSSVVKTVVAKPSIITDGLKERAKQNMAGYSSAVESGKLLEAGAAVGEQMYDIYNISPLALGLGAGAASASKVAKKIYDTHNFKTPILLKFEMGRLNSGIPIDSIKFQKPLTKKDTPKVVEPISVIKEAPLVEPVPVVQTKSDGGTTWEGIELGKGVRSYEGRAIGGIEPKYDVDARLQVDPRYIADARLVVEMPFIGIGHKKATSNGFLRYHPGYWKEILKRTPEAFSERNTRAIQRRRAPIVDDSFIKVFPQYSAIDLRNQTLVHHHIGGGREVFGIPSSLHPGSGGIHIAEKSMHIDNSVTDLSEVLQRLYINSKPEV